MFTNGLKPLLAGLSETEVAAKAVTFARIGQASAEVGAAFALVHAAAACIDGLARPEMLSAQDKARFPRDWAWAAQVSREAVSRLFEAAGGSATFDGSDLQRLWRDVNAASQHYAFVWDNGISDFGRVALGFEPINTIPGKRR
jgi:3-hydroxy-9,10-secoandrosta-1,3,5(10)-triene-9,17-dione monooxygenase